MRKPAQLCAYHFSAFNRLCWTSFEPGTAREHRAGPAVRVRTPPSPADIKCRPPGARLPLQKTLSYSVAFEFAFWSPEVMRRAQS